MRPKLLDRAYVPTTETQRRGDERFVATGSAA